MEFNKNTNGKRINLYLLFPALIFLISCDIRMQKRKQALPVVAYAAHATTGEGALWHPERESLFWVDIEGATLYEFFPGKQDCRQHLFDRMVTTVVPESDSTVIVALQDQLVRVNVDGPFIPEPIAAIDDLQGAVRCNDGKCDASGRLWVGTMSLNGQKETGTLYCVTPSAEVIPRIKNVTISNGLVWTADNRWMYYIDTPTRKIDRYRYEPASGEIVYDGVAVRIPSGYGLPDGMTIDEQGNLWVAHWGGYGVYCWDPRTGRLIEKITVPAPNVASCAFGGADLSELYITTARAGLSEEELKKYPDSGSLFVCRPGVKGVKANYFGKK